MPGPGTDIVPPWVQGPPGGPGPPGPRGPVGPIGDISSLDIGDIPVWDGTQFVGSGELDSRLDAVEGGGITFQDGTVATPGIRFTSDPNSGLVRLSENRMGLVTNGRVGAYINSDGALIVPDVAGGDSLTMGSGTSAGSIISGHNRFFRTFNAARTNTVRLIGVQTNDGVTIGGEYGTNPVIYLKGTDGSNPPVTELNSRLAHYQDNTQARLVWLLNTDGRMVFQRAGGLTAQLQWRNAADTADLRAVDVSDATNDLNLGKDDGITDLKLWGQVRFYDSVATAVEQFRIGTDGVPRWLTNTQTTVGAAGAAAALPLTPALWLRVVNPSGNTLVIPAYWP